MAKTDRWIPPELVERLLEDTEEVEAEVAKSHGVTLAFEPTAEQREYVKNASTAGMAVSDISLMVRWPHNGRPISNCCLMKVFERELYEGRFDANVQVAGSLFKAAMAGNVAAAMFWAKTRMGWRETEHRVELTGKDGAPLGAPMSGVIVVPAAATPEDWERAVSEHQAKLMEKAGKIAEGGGEGEP